MGGRRPRGEAIVRERSPGGEGGRCCCCGYCPCRRGRFRLSPAAPRCRFMSSAVPRCPPLSPILVCFATLATLLLCRFFCLCSCCLCGLSSFFYCCGLPPLPTRASAATAAPAAAPPVLFSYCCECHHRRRRRRRCHSLSTFFCLLACSVICCVGVWRGVCGQPSLVALAGVIPVWCEPQAYPRRTSFAGAGCKPLPMIRHVTTR